MKKVLRGLFVVLEFVLVIYVIIITTFLLCKNKYGYTQFGDNTMVIVDKSNQEELNNFKKGDLVLVTGVNHNEVKVGDVIFYYAVSNDEYIIKQDEVTKVIGENSSYIYTFASDGEKTVSSDNVVGKFDGTSYSSIGGVLSFLQSQIGFLICVILPIMVLFIYQIYSLVILIKNKDDDEEDKKVKKQEEIEML